MIRGTRESSQELIEVRSGHRGHLGVSSVDLGFEPKLVQQNLSSINVRLQANCKPEATDIEDHA